ncbi:MAG: hypothetical protein ABSF45_06920 [Terriglobia bacterium]|jgi:hypothetical protein
MWKFRLRELVALTFIPALAPHAYAQNYAPAWEVFLGGTRLYQSVPYGPTRDSGFTLGISGNINRYFGLEMNSTLLTSPVPGPPNFGDYLRALGGAHFESNSERHVSPFAHFLVGATRGAQNCDFLTVPAGCNTGDWELGKNAFTADLGVGMDVRVFDPFWVRPLQADLFQEYYPGAAKSKFQLSFGCTFRFGRRGKSREH